jgi:hypothetical protein
MRSNANYTAELLAQFSLPCASNATTPAFQRPGDCPDTISHTCSNLMRAEPPHKPKQRRGRMAAGGPLDSPPVRRTPYPAPTSIQHVGVDHRRAQILVAEQFLHRADVIAVLQQVRREGVAQSVAGRAFGE